MFALVSETRFRGRHAVQIESADLRVTVIVEGGHIAEFLPKTGTVYQSVVDSVLALGGTVGV
jgi:hypothetical protein